MYKEHKDCKIPDNSDQKLWRYMNYFKFKHFLRKSALYFSRTDKFKDNFEGTFPEKTDKEFRDHHFFKNNKPQFFDVLQKKRDLLKKFHFISCWNISDYESEQLWKEYLPNTEGVAIQTTVEKLTQSIIDPTDVYFGIVDYVNFEEAIIPIDNIFWPYLHKKTKFEFEHEIRGIVSDIEDESISEWPKEHIQNGFLIKTDIEKLIESIVFSPNSSLIFQRQIQGYLNHYNLKINTTESSFTTSIPLSSF